MAELGVYVASTVLAAAFFALAPGWVLWLMRKST